MFKAMSITPEISEAKFQELFMSQGNLVASVSMSSDLTSLETNKEGHTNYWSLDMDMECCRC